MKLAVISEVAGYPWAGSEELWLEVALRALRMGGRVTACLHPDLHEGSPLERFRDGGGQLCLWRRCGIARLEPLKQRFIPEFSSRKLGDPEVILVSAGSLPSLSYVPGLLDYLARCDVPVVVLCQFNTDLLQMSQAERQAIRSLLGKAAKIWFVSEQNRQVARRQFNLGLEDAGVIYNPMRTKLDAPLPWRSGTSEIVMACVARMETVWKGQDLLVELLASDVWSQRNWRLRFYGEGPDRERLEKWTTTLGLSERVEFPGYVRDLTRIWSEADLMVLPSRAEGTPLAVLEAMMCGRPVVTTDVGGNAEVIDDGITGFLAEAATSASFGKALERAWRAKESWGSMGVAAHRRAVRLAADDPAGVLLESLRKAANSR